LFSDTFNENLPPTDDPIYISRLGAAVYEAMSAGDSEAVWLMQVCPSRRVSLWNSDILRKPQMYAKYDELLVSRIRTSLTSSISSIKKGRACLVGPKCWAAFIEKDINTSPSQVFLC
jgi:hypothetical protein